MAVCNRYATVFVPLITDWIARTFSTISCVKESKAALNVASLLRNKDETELKREDVDTHDQPQCSLNTAESANRTA